MFLRNLKDDVGTYSYETTDRDVSQHFDEIAPYVIGFKRQVRGFSCKGISELGKALLG